MSDCVFCRIIDGSEPATVVGFWDIGKTIIPLNPVTPDHVLFIPIEHQERFEQLSSLARTDLMTAIQQWATRVYRGDYNIIQSNGPAATQTIKHVHFHFVPRREGDGLKLPWSE